MNDEFRPELAVKIAADSVERLRACDVFRVIEWTPAMHRDKVVVYIQRHRPDLDAVTLAAQEELQREGGEG